MSFKPKPCKKIKIEKNSIITLDNKHNEIIKEINQMEDKIPKLKNDMARLEKKMLKTSNIDTKLEINDKINEIHKKIKKYKTMKKNYYLENSKYIFNYFEDKKNIVNDDNKKKMVTNFFYKTTKEEKKEMNNQDYNKLYLMKMNDNFIDINDFLVSYDKCKYCNGELILVEHEGLFICNKCFHQELYINDNEKPSYKEPPKEISVYAYKRINHFREILAQFQAKETTKIEDEVIENIKNQIKKERISLEKLSHEKTKQILKNLGYNKYYEHIPFIKDKLGIKPPTMSIELENKLCNLFIEIQIPYAKFCPDDRVNFLNYYFVLYKLLELLGEDEYLCHLYMLKDPVKRMEQDEIWKQMCNELNWEYIPTL